MDWYRKMLAEFQRATAKVCDDYSFGILGESNITHLAFSLRHFVIPLKTQVNLLDSILGTARVLLGMTLLL